MNRRRTTRSSIAMAVIICGLWLTGCMQISSYQKSVAVISSGLFKTCLVGPERQVTVIAEGAVADQLTVDLQKGDHEIVIAGCDASGEIEMTIAENDQVTVVPVESN